jgi:hypothetical protein
MLEAEEINLIDSAARATAARDTSRQLDMFPLLGAFSRGDKDEIVSQLAERTERYSDGTLTIREADSKLFAALTMGDSLYLVACHAATPAGKVNELTSSMFLVELGPYGDGFEVDAPRATCDQTAASRAAEVKANRERELRIASEESARAFLKRLTEELRRRIMRSREHGLQAELQQQLPYGTDELPLDQIALFAAKLGITIESLVVRSV